MTKTPAILNLALLISAFSITTSGFAADKARQTLLRDGLALVGADGQVKNAEGGEKWLFELGSDLSDEENVVKAGTSLQLLPSTTLEKITADLKERSANNYMLWGIITKYKGENFIFPLYFLATIKTIEPQKPVKVPPAAEKPSRLTLNDANGILELLKTQDEPSEPNKAPPAQESRPKVDISDANGILEIPKEIHDMLKAGKVDRPAKLKSAPKPQKPAAPDLKPAEEPKAKPELEPEPKHKPEPKLETESKSELEPAPKPTKAKRTKLKLDPILADRTAFLVKQKTGRFAFKLDALGRNVQEVSLRLLPCEALELTELRQSAATEPLLFKIAGIKTKYKGKHYLLLQKATRAYSHGNFRAPIL